MNNNDVLGILEDKKFLELFEKKYQEGNYKQFKLVITLLERVQFSCRAQHMNIYETSEEISLMLTNKAIYLINQNLSSIWSALSNIITRRVPITNVTSISILFKHHEIILHVPKEYDIWLKCD